MTSIFTCKKIYLVVVVLVVFVCAVPTLSTNQIDNVIQNPYIAERVKAALEKEECEFNSQELANLESLDISVPKPNFSSSGCYFDAFPQSNTIVLVEDISDLYNLPNLRKLDLQNQPINDLTPLESLTKLQILNLPYKELSNSELEVIANLENLESLSITIANETSLDTIKTLTHLKHLTVRVNNKDQLDNVMTILPELTKLEIYYFLIDDTSFHLPETLNSAHLEELTVAGSGNLHDLSVVNPYLKRLIIDRIHISDPTELTHFLELKELVLKGIPTKHLDLVHFRQLAKLEISDSDLVDLSQLVGLFNLKELILQRNFSLNDISALDEPTLFSLELVNLSTTKVKDFSLLSKAPHLKGLIAEGLLVRNELNLSQSGISSIHGLTFLDISGLYSDNYGIPNGIKSLEGIEKLENLETLDIALTHITDFEPLVSLDNFKKLYIGEGIDNLKEPVLTKLKNKGVSIIDCGVELISETSTLKCLRNSLP